MCGLAGAEPLEFPDDTRVIYSQIETFSQGGLSPVFFFSYFRLRTEHSEDPQGAFSLPSASSPPPAVLLFYEGPSELMVRQGKKKKKRNKQLSGGVRSGSRDEKKGVFFSFGW